MDDNGVWHDAAEDPAASYEHHPVEDIEPRLPMAPELDNLSPEARAEVFQVMATAYEKVLRWMVAGVPQNARTRKSWRPYKGRKDTREFIRESRAGIRALVCAYLLRPEIFQGPVSAASIARQLGMSKQAFHVHVREFREEFGFHSKVMRNAEGRRNMSEAMRKSHARRKRENG